MRIVGARRGFGMVLHAENGLAAMPQSFDSLVVQIFVRDLNIGIAQRVGIDAEAVILRSDFNFSGLLIQDRVIRAVMAEFQLISLAAKGKTQDLMPKTDAKNRRLADQFLHFGGLALERLWIARPVR